MGYISNNPKFDSTILDDIGTTTPGNPASGSHKILNRDGLLYIRDSSGNESSVGGGSGVGEIDYIDNFDAENGVNGWATYVDAAGTTPVDGTGDSGSANITWTSQGSTILRGLKSFKLTKDAADRQGEGVSYDFTIKEQDVSKKLKIQFDFKTDEDAAYAAGDLAVYIYDVTNSTLITPADTDIISGQNIFQTSFSSTTSTSYRLIFHVADSGSDDWTAYIDNVIVGPGMTSQGAVIGPWTAYTPVFNGFGSVTTSNMQWRRVGDSVEMRGEFTTAAADASEARIGLPNNYTVSQNGSNTQIVGTCVTSQNLVQSNHPIATNGDTYINIGRKQYSGGTNALAPITVAAMVGTGQRVSINATVPVLEFAGKGIVPMLAEDNLSEWQAYTPSNTQGFGTITSNNLEYRRVGDSLELRGDFTSGTFTAAEARLGLPSGLTIDGVSTSTTRCGTIDRDGTTASRGVALATKGDSYINFGREDGTQNVTTPVLANTIFPSTTRYTVQAKVPILEWAGSQNSLVGYSLATETQTGLVSTGAQTFGGDKTFADNVGIGTSSPSAKLEVDGDIKLSGNDEMVWGARSGGMKCTNSTSVANNGTLTLQVSGAGPNCSGIIIATNNRNGSGNSTNTVYAFGGRDDSTPGVLFTKNTSSGAAFNATHSNNEIILTNVSGSTSSMSMTVFYQIGY